MVDRKVVKTDSAPAPVGAYSQAIKTGQMLFMAGQIALDPKTNQMTGDDAASQTTQVLKNIEGILLANGLTRGHIVRCVVFVADLNDMPEINRVYGEFFNFEPPARSAVQVARLPLDARVEIEVTAILS